MFVMVFMIVVAICSVYATVAFFAGRDKYCPSCDDEIVIPVIPYFNAYCWECSSIHTFDQLVHKTRSGEMIRPEDENGEDEDDQHGSPVPILIPEDDEIMNSTDEMDFDGLEKPPSF